MSQYMECLATAQTAGTALSTFTTSASLLPSQALHTLPPDWSNYPGRALLIKAAGSISNVVTTSPTFTFNVVFNPSASPVTVFTTGALTTSTTAHTTVPWWLEIMLTVRAVGGSANLMGQATVTSRAFIAASAADSTAVGFPTLLAPATTPAVGSNYSSTASQQVDLQAACQTSNAGNAIQLHQYWLMDMQSGA